MATITGVYAAVLGLFYLALSVRTLRTRRKKQIAVGDGGNTDLLRAIRVHGNFAEYVPFALLLIALLEINGGSRQVIHLLGLALVVGRVSHAYGVSQTKETFAFRVFGMGMTFTAIAGAAGFLLASALL